MILKKILRVNPQNKEERKYYFAPVQGNAIGLDELAARIGQSCSISPTAIKYVLTAFMDQLPYYLKDGHPVQLEPFCTIRLSPKSEGRNTALELTKDDIKSFHLVVTPSAKFKHAINSEEFITGIKLLPDQDSQNPNPEASA